jgi:hypothetical protein
MKTVRHGKSPIWYVCDLPDNALARMYVEAMAEGEVDYALTLFESMFLKSDNKAIYYVSMKTRK